MNLFTFGVLIALVSPLVGIIVSEPRGRLFFTYHRINPLAIQLPSFCIGVGLMLKGFLDQLH